MGIIKNYIEKKKKGMEKLHVRKIIAYKVSNIAMSVFRFLLLLGLGYVILYPLLSMLSYAFNGDYLGNATFVWIPSKFSLTNIKVAITYLEYWDSLKNTVLLAVVSAVLQIFSCSLAGYGFARFNFKGKNLLFLIVLLTIIVPPQTYIISTYLDFRFFNFFGIGKLFGFKVNLINSFWTFWIPSIFSMGLRSGLFIYIFRQFFQGLPRDLEDAAYIDGCGAFKTFLQIMLPNAASACLTVFLFSFVWHWNDYFVSNMMFQIKNEPLSVVMFRQADFSRGKGPVGIDWNMKYMLNAAVLLNILPILVLYVVAQRYFIESIANVGIKG